MSWKKFDKNKPPKVKEFLVVTSNYIKPIIEIVKTINACYGGPCYILETGRIMETKEILWWMELPEFNEEYEYKGKKIYRDTIRKI